VTCGTEDQRDRDDERYVIKQIGGRYREHDGMRDCEAEVCNGSVNAKPKSQPLLNRARANRHRPRRQNPSCGR
jgi:hypothetical protein